MSNDTFFHADCGGRLSIWAGMIYCECGHVPLDVNPDMDSTEITDFLPYLIQAGIIAQSDFQGMVLKQI